MIVMLLSLSFMTKSEAQLSLIKENTNISVRTIKHTPINSNLWIQKENSTYQHKNSEFFSRDLTNYWAVIVGVSEYLNPDINLNYADNDAIDITNVLVNYHYWDLNNIILLIDSNATWDNIINSIWYMAEYCVDSNDVFLFSYSGHGTYWVDDNGDEIDGYDEGIVTHDLYLITDDDLEIALSWLNSSANSVFLDSCYSGGLIKNMMKNPRGNFTIRTIPDRPLVVIKDGIARDLDNSGFVVLTACDEDEYSVESSFFENGVFTFYFVEGLSSGFPADSNSNEKVSAEEAFNYVSPRANAFNPTQNPQIYDGVSGELEYTILPNTDPSVEWIRAWESSAGRLDPGGEVSTGCRVRMYSRVGDLETPASDLNVSISYRPQGGGWTTEAAAYHAGSNYWYVDWDIPEEAAPGLYDIKVDVEDPHGGTASSTELGEFTIA